MLRIENIIRQSDETNQENNNIECRVMKYHQMRSNSTLKKNCKLAYLGAMSGGIPIVKHRAHVDKHMPRS